MRVLGVALIGSLLLAGCGHVYRKSDRRVDLGGPPWVSLELATVERDGKPSAGWGVTDGERTVYLDYEFEEVWRMGGACFLARRASEATLSCYRGAVSADGRRIEDMDEAGEATPWNALAVMKWPALRNGGTRIPAATCLGVIRPDGKAGAVDWAAGVTLDLVDADGRRGRRFEGVVAQPYRMENDVTLIPRGAASGPTWTPVNAAGEPIAAATTGVLSEIALADDKVVLAVQNARGLVDLLDASGRPFLSDVAGLAGASVQWGDDKKRALGFWLHYDVAGSRQLGWLDPYTYGAKGVCAPRWTECALYRPDPASSYRLVGKTLQGGWLAYDTVPYFREIGWTIFATREEAEASARAAFAGAQKAAADARQREEEWRRQEPARREKARHDRIDECMRAGRWMEAYELANDIDHPTICRVLRAQWAAGVPLEDFQLRFLKQYSDAATNARIDAALAQQEAERRRSQSGSATAAPSASGPNAFQVKAPAGPSQSQQDANYRRDLDERIRKNVHGR